MHDVARLSARTAQRYRDLVSVEPMSPSLADGAAGVAYFLRRHAAFSGEEASLHAARRWAAKAEQACESGGGFLGGAPTQSLHYREPGVWWVSTLVAQAAGDADAAGRAAERFARTARSGLGTPGDLNSGSAGLLLGCAHLVESLDEPLVTSVRAIGEQLAGELLTLAEREGAVPGETALGYLGAAHGWAGVAHALLRWSRATSLQPAPQVVELLERLIELRRPSGRWPVRAGSNEVWLGWCHGSAGWAELWALAWQATGEDERFLRLAEHSATDAVAGDDVDASLCCGRAGQGFAALSLYRITGDRQWLDGAERVAADAARRAEALTFPAHDLFAGELGIALLATELEDPARGAMPVSESIA
jgi:lantibiotic modifying enzyme